MTTELPSVPLVFDHTFDAPVEQVWAAFNECDKLRQWWGPHHFDCPVADMDVREGGISLVAMHNPKFGTSYSTWMYERVDPLERLDFVHHLADKEGNPVDPVSMGMPADFPQPVRYTLIFECAGPGRTRLRLTEYGWTPGKMMELSRTGMNQCLEKLDAWLAQEEARSPLPNRR